jgi:3-oxoacyl-[acyl-carrier protein] reductase
MNTLNFAVIGGTKGIGHHLVVALAEAGHKVTAFARNAPTEAVPGVQYHTFDAALPLDAALLPDPLHGLAYCPGTINLKPFNALKDDMFRDDFDLNVLGAVRCIRAALPALKRGSKAEGASVVLFSTVAVQTGMAYHASVAASKGAIEGLARSLAAEFARDNIRVNAIAPSVTDTPLAQGLLRTDQQREGAANRHPLQRIGQPNDVAQAAIYLLTPASAWMTGQVLHLDGGMGALRML